MEENKLDYLKGLLDKYELRQNTENGDLKAYLKGQNRAVNLASAKMTDLAFAYAWARAWVEAGCYEYDKPVSERKIPGFDAEGKKVYDVFFDVMKRWAKGKEFHYYIDHFRMADKVQKESDNPNASRIVFQLLRPDRLDTKSEFHELYETGRMTTDLVNQDEWVKRTYRYILNEAEYTSEKGLQPGE